MLAYLPYLILKHLPYTKHSSMFDTKVSPTCWSISHIWYLSISRIWYYNGCTHTSTPYWLHHTHTHTHTHTNTHKHTYTHMNTRLYAYLYSYRVHFITTTNYGGLKTDLQTEWEFVADIHINRVWMCVCVYENKNLLSAYVSKYESMCVYMRTIHACMYLCMRACMYARTFARQTQT